MSLLDGILSISELELENQRVFLRADLDVPLNKAGEVLDDTRLTALVPTIKKLQELGARVIIGSRFGEAKKARAAKSGKNQESWPSIEPAAAKLSELCECEVLLPDAATGESVKKVMGDLRSTQICVLENLAREADTGAQAEAFARKLEEYTDIYIGDSVAALETESASSVLLPRLIEEDFRAAGPGLMKELSAISRIRSGIDAPRLIIWGGNSLSGRLDVLDRLAKSAAHVMLVGVAGNTMLRALGGSVGRSAIEEEYLAGARSLAERLGPKLIVPQDLLVAESPKSSEAILRPADRVKTEEMALDMGPETQKQLRKLAAESGTIIWCGTAGFHKSEVFSSGTRSICEAMAESSAFTMVVGDDTVAAAHTVGRDTLESIDCVALGGTAALALLNETRLPGLEALRGNISDE